MQFNLKAIKKSFKLAFTGQISKKAAGIYLVFYFLVYYSLIFISCLIFVQIKPFSMLSHFISHLGMPDENPRGFLFFSLAEIWNGLFFIPMTMFFYRNLSRDLIFDSNPDKKPRKKKIIKVSNLIAVYSGIVSGLGTVIIGIFPQDFSHGFDSNFLHLIGVNISFFGIYIGVIFNFLSLFLRKSLKLEFPKSYKFSLIHLQFISVSLIFWVVTNLMHNLEPGLWSTYFWEWMMVFSLSLWVLLFYLIIPDDVKKFVEISN
jgi:hypothetical protein